jgi:hypothetical protein
VQIKQLFFFGFFYSYFSLHFIFLYLSTLIVATGLRTIQFLFKPVIVSGKMFARSHPGSGGCCGHMSSWYKNCGPENQVVASFIFVTVNPLVAASAGFNTPGWDPHDLI